MNPVLAAKFHSDQDVLISIFRIAKDLSYIHQYFRSPYRNSVFRAPDDDRSQVRYYIDRQQMFDPARYEWSSQLLSSLSEEYSNRFKKTHKLNKMIKILKRNPIIYKYRYTSVSSYLSEPRFSIAQIPNKFRCADVVVSYRAYYQETRPFSKWNHSDPPYWWTEDQYQLVKQIRYKNNVVTLSGGLENEHNSSSTSIDIPSDRDNSDGSLPQMEISFV